MKNICYFIHIPLLAFVNHRGYYKSDMRILLIEDDKFLADLMLKRFRKEGLDVDLALDGETGLEKVRKTPFDLILLDLLLPGMDGYKVLEILKADRELARIPVMILSNLGQQNEIDRGLKLGAIDFLVKAHFDLDEITDKIKKVETKQ